METARSNRQDNMPPPLPDEPMHRFDVKADASTHFAWLRTRLSAERTLMSWVRTCVSLIGFGFSIFQFFARLSSMPNVAPAAEPHLARRMALALIGAGILGLCVALVQYQWVVGYLWQADFRPVAGVTRDRWTTSTFGVAILLIFIGLAAFIAVYLRVT